MKGRQGAAQFIKNEEWRMKSLRLLCLYLGGIWKRWRQTWAATWIYHYITHVIYIKIHTHTTATATAATTASWTTAHYRLFGSSSIFLLFFLFRIDDMAWASIWPSAASRLFDQWYKPTEEKHWHNTGREGAREGDMYQKRWITICI